MEQNRKYFNSYVFISTFARSLIEIFVGTILFKAGFTLKEVILYYVFINIFSFILDFPYLYIAKKHSNRVLSIIGIVSFLSLQLALNFVHLTYWYLLLLSFLFASYRRGYWISRRYYTFQVIDNQNISKEYSFISILNQLALLLSSYIGSLLLEYISIKVIIIISILLLIISLYCVFKIKLETEINKFKINLKESLKVTPFKTIINIGCYELQNVISFLLPLYIIIYVKNTYTAVGIINLLAQLATIIFLYVYGLLINKNKNYLKFSIIFFIIFKVLQVETYGVLLFIITFISGLAAKMYEQSYHKELLILSKNYEFHNFNLVYECIQNLFRMVVAAILYFFVSDVRIMIYIVLGIMILPLILKFNTSVKMKKSDVLWKE